MEEVVRDEDILARQGGDEFAVVADDIFAHHERWDGSGYPRKLKGENTPYLASIFLFGFLLKSINTTIKWRGILWI